jgi:hypothetical protein
LIDKDVGKYAEVQMKKLLYAPHMFWAVQELLCCGSPAPSLEHRTLYSCLQLIAGIHELLRGRGG